MPPSFNRLPLLSRLILPRTSLTTIRITAVRPASTASGSSADVVGDVVTDQTKHDNEPSNDKKQSHKEAGNKVNEDASERSDHPAKQPDPQKSPERSTGLETEGPGGSKAGKGDVGGVHKEDVK